VAILPEVMMALNCIDLQKIIPYVVNGFRIQVRKIEIFYNWYNNIKIFIQMSIHFYSFGQKAWKFNTKLLIYCVLYVTMAVKNY